MCHFLVSPGGTVTCVSLPCVPRWYRNLCVKRTEEKYLPGSVKISPQMRVVPYLLRMKYEGHPLHHHPRLGWGYIVSSELGRGKLTNEEGGQRCVCLSVCLSVCLYMCGTMVQGEFIEMLKYPVPYLLSSSSLQLSVDPGLVAMEELMERDDWTRIGGVSLEDLSAIGYHGDEDGKPCDVVGEDWSSELLQFVVF